MPSQEATGAAVLNAAPLSLLLTVLFMVVLAMCGPSAICVPEVMAREEERVRGNSQNPDPDSNSFAARHVYLDSDLDASGLSTAAVAVGLRPKREML